MSKPSEELKDLQKSLAGFALKVGVDIYEPHPKPNHWVIGTSLLSVTWQILVISTIYSEWPDKTIFFLSLVHFSFFSQGLFRGVNLGINPMMTSNLRQLSGDFFKQHEINSNSKSLLCDSLSTSKLFTTILTFFNTILLNGSAIIFIIFMFTGKKILLLPVFIPFVNHEALLGYLLNLGLQMSMGFIGFFTFTSYDTTIILYGMHSILMARMFEIKMKDLEGTLKNEENKLQYRQKFIETVKYYEDYKSFMREFENLVKIPFLVAICVNFVGLVCCIMELINESMELGIAGSAGLFVGFLLPFLTVIMISYQDTIITRSISQFPWNDIPPAYQNLHLHFLISTQHHFGINLSFLGFLRFPLVTTIFLTLHHIVAYFLVFALFPHHNRVALG